MVRRELWREESWDESSSWREMAMDQFHEAAAPKETPLPVYAAWLCAWRRDGGKVTHPRDYNYSQCRFLTPTRTTDLSIPKGTLDLLIIPSLAVVGNTRVTSDRDFRRWGNTTVRLLKRTGIKRQGVIPEAVTNRSSCVETFPDVEEFIQRYGARAIMQNCMSGILDTMRNMRGSEKPGKLPELPW